MTSRLQRAPVRTGLAAVQSVPEETVEVQVEQPAKAAPAVKLRKQGGYYAHDAEMSRARSAWKHTELLPGGFGSWSEFQLAAVMELTERLEREHNGGEQWPPLPAGQVKHSRRTS